MEHHLLNTSFFGSMLIVQGVRVLFPLLDRDDRWISEPSKVGRPKFTATCIARATSKNMVIWGLTATWRFFVTFFGMVK